MEKHDWKWTSYHDSTDLHSKAIVDKFITTSTLLVIFRIGWPGHALCDEAGQSTPNNAMAAGIHDSYAYAVFSLTPCSNLKSKAHIQHDVQINVYDLNPPPPPNPFNTFFRNISQRESPILSTWLHENSGRRVRHQHRIVTGKHHPFLHNRHTRLRLVEP